MKKGGRFNYRTNKRFSFSKANSSYGKYKSRPRANINIPVLYDKYIKLAKEASSSGDRIQAEYYHQFADHYSRVMIENGDRTFNSENINDDSNKDLSDNSKQENNQTVEKQSEEQPIEETIIKVDQDNKKENLENDKDDDSLEDVSFIAEPPKKTPKAKKST